MAYDRVLRAKLFESSRFLDLSNPATRLLFIGLLTEVDDFGNTEADLRLILRWSTAWSGFDTRQQIALAIDDLAQQDLVRKYSVDGEDYLHLPRFRSTRNYVTRRCPPSPWCNPKSPTGAFRPRNDRVDYRTSVNPDSTLGRHIHESNVSQDQPHASESDTDLCQTNTGLCQTDVRVSGDLTIGVERSGEERRNTSHSTSSSAVKGYSGACLPRDWVIPSEWVEWTINYAAKKGTRLTWSDVMTIADDFADYWHSIAGAKGVRADWFAVWRSRIRALDLVTIALKSDPDGLLAMFDRAL